MGVTDDTFMRHNERLVECRFCGVRVAVACDVIERLRRELATAVETEREACAALCDSARDRSKWPTPSAIACAIRERGEIR